MTLKLTIFPFKCFACIVPVDCNVLFFFFEIMLVVVVVVLVLFTPCILQRYRLLITYLTLSSSMELLYLVMLYLF